MAVALSAMRLRLRSNSSQVIATLVLILEQHVPFGDGAAHTAANASHGCSAPNAKPQSRVRRRHCASRSPRSGVRYQLRDPAARTSEIVVNDLDRRPAEHASAMGEAILAAITRMVVQELIKGRLTNVEMQAVHPRCSPVILLIAGSTGRGLDGNALNLEDHAAPAAASRFRSRRRTARAPLVAAASPPEPCSAIPRRSCKASSAQYLRTGKNPPAATWRDDSAASESDGRRSAAAGAIRSRLFRSRRNLPECR